MIQSGLSPGSGNLKTRQRLAVIKRRWGADREAERLEAACLPFFLSWGGVGGGIGAPARWPQPGHSGKMTLGLSSSLAPQSGLSRTEVHQVSQKVCVRGAPDPIWRAGVRGGAEAPI